MLTFDILKLEQPGSLQGQNEAVQGRPALEGFAYTAERRSWKEWQDSWDELFLAADKAHPFAKQEIVKIGWKEQ